MPRPPFLLIGESRWSTRSRRMHLQYYQRVYTHHLVRASLGRFFFSDSQQNSLFDRWGAPENSGASPCAWIFDTGRGADGQRILERFEPMGSESGAQILFFVAFSNTSLILGFTSYSNDLLSSFDQIFFAPSSQFHQQFFPPCPQRTIVLQMCGEHRKHTLPGYITCCDHKV